MSLSLNYQLSYGRFLIEDKSSGYMDINYESVSHISQ